MAKKRQDFTLFVQRLQTNKFFPVERYRRKDGRWYYATQLKEDNEKGYTWTEVEYAPNRDAEWKDKYFWFMFLKGEYSFLKEEKKGGRKKYDSDYKIEEIHELIFNK